MRRLQHAASCLAASGVPAPSLTIARLGAVTGAAAAAGPVFDAIPHWCALCCEPISSWAEHVGKREHIALGMVFDAVVAAPRVWRAETVWQDADDYLAPLRCRHAQLLASTPSTRFRQRHHLPQGAYVPCEDSPWHDMFHWYDRHDTAVGRRVAIHDSLRACAALGVFEPLVTPSYFSAAAFHGTLVLFKDLFPPLAKVFPRAAAKDISAMTQVISTAFHLETVFDLCEMGSVVPQSLLDARRQSLPEKTTATTTALSSPSDPSLPPPRVQGSVGADDGTVTLKANVVRAVLGLMRWAVEPESLQTSFTVPSDSRFPPHMVTATANDAECLSACWSAAACSADAIMARHTAQLLVTELIGSRLAEYVSRVEPVVREQEVRHGGGSLDAMHDRLQRQHRSGAAPLVPVPNHAGAVAYLHNDIVSGLNPFGL